MFPFHPFTSENFRKPLVLCFQVAGEREHWQEISEVNPTTKNKKCLIPFYLQQLVDVEFQTFLYLMSFLLVHCRNYLSS